MRRDEMHIVRQMRAHVTHHRAFDGADVGHGCARRQMRADFLCYRAASADRNADNDEVGAFNGGRAGLHDLIGDAEFGYASAGCLRACGSDNRTDRTLRTRRTRDR